MSTLMILVLLDLMLFSKMSTYMTLVLLDLMLLCC